MAPVNTPRTAVLNKLYDLCVAVNNNRYYVRRGPINWTAHDFHAYPYALSILTPSFSMLRPVFNELVVSFEVVMSLPETSHQRGEEREGLNDNEIESLVVDVDEVIHQLITATDSNGDSVISRIDRENAEAQEISNEDWKIQGFQVIFTVEY